MRPIFGLALCTLLLTSCGSTTTTIKFSGNRQPIHEAAGEGDLAEVTRLLDEGASGKLVIWQGDASPHQQGEVSPPDRKKGVA